MPNPNPSPVVIIPGYYGTLLIDKGAADKVVWLTLGSMFESGDVLDAINLETGDPDRIVSGGILEEIQIVGNWAPNFYKTLRMFFGSIGFAPENVISFGVDWRRTLSFNVDQLRARIERAGRANIVAHSHGGLIAREYLRKYGDDPLVDSLITLGTPHRGMLLTFEALVQGIGFFGWSKSHLMKTARTFPSAYELLPFNSADGFFEWDGNPKADAFTQTAWADASMLGKISDAAGVVAGLPKELKVKSALIYGTHRDTKTRAVGSPNKKMKFETHPAGDGTVPTLSASGKNLTGLVERYAIPYGLHSQLFDYEPAQSIMKNILFDRPKPHFAVGFSREMYMTGKPLGIAVDLRDLHGERFADADVRISLRGATPIPIPRDEASGDHFLEINMPPSPQHIQYKITASASKLSQPFTDVGVLHPMNN
jgi:pimeloyl-ACP methyl ester carboxylesterase